jgi:hypothetical protein
MIVYEIVKLVGIGVVECPISEHRTGLIYANKEMAKTEAERLYKENTTEQERNSGWCNLFYEVKEVAVIPNPSKFDFIDTTTSIRKS